MVQQYGKNWYWGKKDVSTDQDSPFLKKGSILVVWLSAKKGLFEYLRKHPASTARPTLPGRHSSALVDATVKQSRQPFSLIVSTHCATACTVALPSPPTTSFLLAAKKPLILGVATWRSANNSFTAALKAVGCDVVWFSQIAVLPGWVVWP